MKQRIQKAARRLGSGLVGAAAGMSLLLGGLFDTAEDLLPEEERRAGLSGGTSTVMREQSHSAEPVRIPLPAELTAADRLRQWIWHLPSMVRAIVLLPIWALGRGMIALLRGALRMLSPIFGFAARFFLQGLLLFALFLVLYRLLFPNGSIRTLLRKGRWLWLLGGALLLSATDRIFLLTLEDWPWIRLLLGAGMAMLVLLLVWNRLFHDHAAPKPPEKWIEIPHAA